MIQHENIELTKAEIECIKSLRTLKNTGESGRSSYNYMMNFIPAVCDTMKARAIIEQQNKQKIIQFNAK